MNFNLNFEFKHSGLRAEGVDTASPDRSPVYGEQPSSGLRAEAEDESLSIAASNEKSAVKKAILLLHGMTGSPFELKQYGKNLYKAGFDVFCPCLPGHGQNIKDVRKVKWQDWLDFAENEYKALKSSYDEVYLGGLCMGAVLALAIAEKNKDAAGIIAISTTLFLDGWTIPWYRFLMPLGLHTVLRYYYTFSEREPYGIKNKAVRKKISSLLKENTVALDYIPMTCVYELLEMSKYVRKIIKNIDLPILIMHSKQDDLTSLRSSNFVYKNISSKIKEYIICDDSYHLIVMDNDKDLAIKKSVEFLESISLSNKSPVEQVV